MMIFNKILQACQLGSAMPIPNVGKAELDRIAALMTASEKFNFGDLVLERNYKKLQHDGTPGYRIPEVTADELQWWVDGLIPLPAPVAWYEFSLSYHQSAILAVDDGHTLKVTRIDWEKGAALVTNLWWATARSAIEQAHNQQLVVISEGNEEFRRKMDELDPEWSVSDSMNTGLCLYLTLMINSKSTERERVAAGSPSMAKARGVLPRPAHTIVRIVPDRYLRTKPDGSRAHASPRLHWRRSHVRTYDHPTPQARPYQGKWGVVIPRILVGKAELGEISHEYWVPERGGVDA